MKLGLVYQPDSSLSLGAVLHQSKLADEQGFDSLWLTDHVAGSDPGSANPHEPPDSMTLMAAMAAVTSRVQLAWAMLNPGFRNPALLAKMLATMDQISNGRIICSLGSGSRKAEYDAYGMQFVEDKSERVAFTREVVMLLKELWTNVAPAAVTFHGNHVHAEALQFSPQPYRKPHPPIWIGGDSPETLELARDLADGWVFAKRPGSEYPRNVLSAPDWPSRPMTVACVTGLVVAETREAAVADAKIYYDRLGNSTSPRAKLRGTFEEFVEREIVGSPEDCAQRIRELASFGVNHLIIVFEDAKQQNNIASLLLPLVGQAAKEPVGHDPRAALSA